MTAFSGGAATALKAEPEAKLSPAQQLETRTQPQAAPKQSVSDKRAEAKAKGYEGDSCGECGNFTLVQQRHVYEVRYVWRDQRVLVEKYQK